MEHLGRMTLLGPIHGRSKIVHWKLSRGGTHPFGSMAHDACDILGQAQGTGFLVHIVNALALALQFAILPLVWQHLQLHVRIL